MFDSEVLAGLPARQLLDAVVTNQQSKREAECSELLLAAAWADEHDHPNSHDEQDERDEWHRPQIIRTSIDGDRDRTRIDEDVVAEFGAVLGVGMIAARNLIGDAVALRHRFPRLWLRIRGAEVPAWQTRKVAQACSQLSWDQAVEVDDRLSRHLGLLPWPRFERLLAAAILDVDPEGVRARELRARTERFVRAHDTGDGLKLLIAKAASGDVAWFMAAINRIADILKEDGDTDSIEVRRSRAIGILANPAGAWQLIAQHARPDHTVRRPDDVVDPSAPAVQAEPEPVDIEDPETGLAVPGTDTDPQVSSDQTHVSLSSALPSGLSAADLNRAAMLPKATLYLHLSDVAVDPDGPGGLVRPEHGRPLSLIQLREFLTDTGCHLTVKPVIDPAATAPVDSYEIPHRIREAVRLRHPVDVFPYASSDLRELDLDHTRPYLPRDRGGPPGQTGLHNLGPLSRGNHRAATRRFVPDGRGPSGRITGRWRKRQPSPGLYLWRSPHGHTYLTTNQGTLALGMGPFVDQVWIRAAQSNAAHSNAAHSNAAQPNANQQPQSQLT